MQPQWVWAGKAFSGGLVKDWWGDRRWFCHQKKYCQLKFSTYSQALHDTIKMNTRTDHRMTIYKLCERGLTVDNFCSALKQKPQRWSSTPQQSCSSSGLLSSLCTQSKVSVQLKRRRRIAPHCSCGLMSKTYCSRQLIYKIKCTRNTDEICKKVSFMQDFIWYPARWWLVSALMQGEILCLRALIGFLCNGLSLLKPKKSWRHNVF